MPSDVRIVLAGDSGVGKSTLITSLIKEAYVEKVQRRIPEITLPNDVCPEGVSTKIIDTCSAPDHRTHLETQLRRASVICLVYSIADPSSFDRLPTYWLPFIRSLGINVPVILVGNQIDQRTGGPLANAALEAELAPVMGEFKEVETCVECSAKVPLNVSEVFYFAQKAVLYPTAPLYDSRAHTLKPAAVQALRRIFRLCDADKDGILSDAELNDFQRKCFDAPLQTQELEGIKHLVLQAPVAGSRFPYSNDEMSATGSMSDAGGASSTSTTTPATQRPHPHLREGGLTLSGFLYLHTLFIQRGRLETTWTVLRTFGYAADLTLQDSFIFPSFVVPHDCSAELSPHGYQFLTDIFEAHDKDRDGALSPRELAALFSTVPATSSQAAGTHPWGEDFPQGTTVTDEAGRVTLQGWLAQWSMTTLLEPKTTLAQLAYLGYPSFVAGSSSSDNISSSSSSAARSKSNNRSTTPSPPSVTTALQMTKPRRVDRKKKGKIQRSVLLAYVVGAAGSGKSTILRSMLGHATWEETYKPTGRTYSVVSSVEQGGAEKYLVLQEFGSRYEAEALRNAGKLQAADVILFVYDSSDTNSFSYISNLRQQYPLLAGVPSLFVATKADLDLAQQRHEVQPDAYCAKLGLRIPGIGGGAGPLSISVHAGELADLYPIVCAIALDPRGAIPGGAESGGTLGFGAWRRRWAVYVAMVVLVGGGAFLVGTRTMRSGGSVGIGNTKAFTWLSGATHNAAGTGATATSARDGDASAWFSWIWNPRTEL